MNHSNLESLMKLHLSTGQPVLDQFMLSQSDDALTAVWDYGASPYALGDTLTWSMLSSIEALNAGKKFFDVCTIVHREKPNSSLQPYINSNNYQFFLIDVLPAFFVNPMLRDFHLYQDRESLEMELFYKNITGQVMFPDFKEHISAFRKAYGLYNSHDTINAFFEKNGFIPRLKVPVGYQTWARDFLKNHNPHSNYVCIHLRNRGQHKDQTLAELYRDGDFELWLEFFDIAYSKYPNVKFVILGRPMEWPRAYFQRQNLLILKSFGYGLLEELAMIGECDFFMATNSGPGVMAIFGEKPYVLFQPDENAVYTAKVYGIEPGQTRLPFALPEQSICWKIPELEDLLDTLDHHLAVISGKENRR